MTLAGTPLLQRMASENLSMTRSILLSLDTFQRIKEMMDIANVSFFNDTTYDSLQGRYVFPAINKICNAHKESIILRAREEESLDLLGNGGAIP